jgi:hypothetical protein
MEGRRSLVVGGMLPDQLQVHLLQRRLADDVVQHAQLRRESGCGRVLLAAAPNLRLFSF